MQPHEVIREAIKGGHVKGVALRLGKSEDYVYKMMANAEDCRYTRFLQFFTAIFEENQIGAEEIFEDFRARLLMLREKSGKAKSETVDWIDAVAKTVEESSQAIKAAIEDRDPIRIEKEIAEAIVALRSLNKLVIGRAERGPRALAVGGRA